MYLEAALAWWLSGGLLRARLCNIDPALIARRSTICLAQCLYNGRREHERLLPASVRLLLSDDWVSLLRNVNRGRGQDTLL